MKRPYIEGIVKRHPDGFGFLIADDPDQPDVYLPRHEMTGVMTNDRVAVQVFPEPGGDRFRGEVMRVVARAAKKVVGRLHVEASNAGLLTDESHAWGANLHVPSDRFNGAKDGDLVAVEILTYPSEDQPFTGRVVDVIGDADDPLNDVKRVIHTQTIPSEFSREALEEASRLGTEVSEKDMADRRDLRDLNFITIDGVTARDFDDAVLVEANERGFRLWVAIADVSHYVKPNSPIDRDAYERGTSVYFPNFVVPMLPEVLSNELCSLKPRVPRLTLVAEMQFNHHGECSSSAFYEAVIESKARVTYGEAQEVIDGSPVAKLKHVAAEIRRAADLAKILMAKRFREGSLDLEVPESQLQIDDTGNPVDIVRSERLFAHRLIEEMMLAANVAVAEYFEKRSIAALYRIHEEPAPDSIDNLQRFLYNFGGTPGLGGGKLQKRLTKALQSFEGKPQAQILNILTLRTMKQARYSASNVGHFGLGFSDYTHFTSPIRRYPDLIVHRLLKALLQVKGYRLMGEEALQTAGTILSACEQRAVKAERQLVSIKKSRFMKSKVGQEFEGIISSVAKFGIFVLLRDFDVDGLVKIDALAGGERFEFDPENLRLVAKRSGFSYEIGDPVRVVVAGADPDAGQIDFVLAKEQPSKPQRMARAPYVSERPAESRSKAERSQPKPRHEHRQRSERHQAQGGRPEKPKVEKKAPAHPFEKFLKKGGKPKAKKSVREQFLARSRGGEEEESGSKGSASQSRKLRAAELFSSDESSEKAQPGKLVRKMKVSTRGVKLGADSQKKTDRKDGPKRGENANDRGGVRKARVSKRR